MNNDYLKNTKQFIKDNKDNFDKWWNDEIFPSKFLFLLAVYCSDHFDI